MADFNTTPAEENFENNTFNTQEAKNPSIEPTVQSSNLQGLTAEEIRDPNKIKVTIADYDSPIIVLFGPPSCGKTMTLVRLARYLKNQGYSIQPDTSFRPSYDWNYAQMCEDFPDMLNSDNAAENTARINFMLIKIQKDGRTLCQILEAPGEHYFDPEPKKLNNPIVRYVNAIINSKNRKIWAIMVEPAHTNKAMTTPMRRSYVDKIKKFKTKFHPRDRIIFIYNKIDETPFSESVNNIKYPLAMQQVAYDYPSIFSVFTNENPITRLWKKYKFDFIAHQTGSYHELEDGSTTFEEGSDIYPQNLWNLLLQRIHG